MRWVLDDVRSALLRFRALKNGRPAMTVTRLEVGSELGMQGHVCSQSLRSFEMFSQITRSFGKCTMRKCPRQASRSNSLCVEDRDGAFLSLPIEHFNVFDKANRQRVIVYEVLGVLTLFCVGIQAEKMQFLFRCYCLFARGTTDCTHADRCVRLRECRLFDFDNSGSMSTADMMILLQCLSHGLFNAGVTKRRPPIAELEGLSRVMFSRADMDKVTLAVLVVVQHGMMMGSNAAGRALDRS